MEKLFEDLMTLLTEDMPELRYIDIDRGQLDEEPEQHYQIDFPACLIRITVPQWNSVGDKHYVGSANVTFKLGIRKLHDTAKITPEAVRAKAFEQLAINTRLHHVVDGYEGRVNNALQKAESDMDYGEKGLIIFLETYRCEVQLPKKVNTVKKTVTLTINKKPGE